jgi:hypothetical protein
VATTADHPARDVLLAMTISRWNGRSFELRVGEEPESVTPVRGNCV